MGYDYSRVADQQLDKGTLETFPFCNPRQWFPPIHVRDVLWLLAEGLVRAVHGTDRGILPFFFFKKKIRLLPGSREDGMNVEAVKWGAEEEPFFPR